MRRKSHERKVLVFRLCCWITAYSADRIYGFSTWSRYGFGNPFTCVFSVTHTQLLHRRMLHTDSSYRINVLDERNIAIKEKAGNITNMITLMLLGIAMLIFITLNYMVSAIIVGVIILIQPLVLIIASSIIEKKI